MWFMLVSLVIVVLMPFILLVLSMLVKVNKGMNLDSFECGFDSFNVSMLPVSLRFFVFCIIFLILDLELIVFTLAPIVIWSSGWVGNILIFLILVTVSLLSEWLFGSLSWIE